MIGGLAIEPRKSGTSARAGWVVYLLGSRRFALPLAVVDRVLPAVEITPLPQASAQLIGVINFQGRVVPVVDGRARHGMPGREMDVNDQFLIVRAGPLLVALWVDQVEDVLERGAHEIIPAGQIAPGMNVQGALKLADGTIVLLEDGSQLLKGLNTDQLELPIKI